MCSWKRLIGPTSRRATATIEVPNMERKIIPKDPSLAFCQLCVHCGEIEIPVYQDGELHHFPTCEKIITGCNDFEPKHPADPQHAMRLLANNATYGRFGRR